VTCQYCGARNTVDAKNCSQCGADLSAATARKAGEVLGAFQSAPQPDIQCPYCGELNPANALKCKKCSGSLAQKPIGAPKPAAQAASARRSPIGLIAIGVIVVIAIAFLFFRTMDTTAAVQSLSWDRQIKIMAQRPVTHETWQDQIPSGAQAGSCTQKVRRTQDNPAPNSDKVCGTPYTIDQGNGTAKVVQDCQYQVKDNWCQFTQLEWTVVDAVVAKGNDSNPKWPPLNLSAGQREGDRAEDYEVVFSSDGKQYKYSPKDAAEFSQFTIGSRWTLKVNTLGGVTGVTPAK
jgi:ribosomal protein L40E